MLKNYTYPSPSKAILSLNSDASDKIANKNSDASDIIANKNSDTSGKIAKAKQSKISTSKVGDNKTNHLSVTAVIAIMEPATESPEISRKKLPMVSRPSNKVKVLLDSGSDGDLYFLQKEQTNTFPT